jgi:hypothetical protein
MASTDARPVPKKNTAYRTYFPLLDADGDLVTGATGLDSEYSIDGAAFSDCASEATEIATNSGMYYLDLTAAEMNGDAISVIVKTSTVGAKTTPMIFYPQESGDILSTTEAMNAGVVTATAIAADAITAAKIASNAITSAKIAADAIGASQVADGAIDAGAIAADAITAAKIATGAIDADALASDAVDEIWAKAMSDISAVPAMTGSALSALNWLFALARNKRIQTSALETVYKDDGSTSLATSAKSDDGVTFTRAEYS